MNSTKRPFTRPLVFKHTTDTLRLIDILNNYDPNKWEKAKTTYRKPRHQRMTSKKLNWKQELVESVLAGRSIDGILLSKHLKVVDGNVSEYCDIENGQTRLGVLLEFMEGGFELDTDGTAEQQPWGYEDIPLRERSKRFDDYKISAITLQKGNPRMPEKDYQHNLVKNFILLQEGIPLTPSDRYWAQRGFSPLVDISLKLYKKFETQFKKYISSVGISDDTKKTRQNLAILVGIVAGSMFGCKYANTSYYDHIPILFHPSLNEFAEEEVPDSASVSTDFSNDSSQSEELMSPASAQLEEESDYEEATIITDAGDMIKNIFDIIASAYTKRPTIPHERVSGKFKSLPKCIGLMIADLLMPEASFNTEIRNMRFERRWVHYINERRNGEKEFFDKIFKDINDGSRRNSKEADIILKVNKIREYYVQMNIYS